MPMKRVQPHPLLLALALGGCASGAHFPPYVPVALEGEASLLYRSDRGPRDAAADRALALQARSFFCAHYSDWACTADGIVYVSIVSNPPHVQCAIVVSGEKYRIANPRDRLNGLARTDCFAGGRPAYYAETLSEPGVVAITDGPGSLMASPRRLDVTEPVTVVNAAEVADDNSTPDRPR